MPRQLMDSSHAVYLWGVTASHLLSPPTQIFWSYWTDHLSVCLISDSCCTAVQPGSAAYLWNLNLKLNFVIGSNLCKDCWPTCGALTFRQPTSRASSHLPAVSLLRCPEQWGPTSALHCPSIQTRLAEEYSNFANASGIYFLCLFVFCGRKSSRDVR